MIGSPGTGKTLLARAIAGEADVPFFSISGSDFVEMFVGVGASRVRDMFEQGRKSAPCLIFIDEIDAVGRHRGHGVGGGHDEREQTLNALLVEMDGFDAQEGIIIIAATNRPDVLDPALLRPGTFRPTGDRATLPDVKGREADPQGPRQASQDRGRGRDGHRRTRHAGLLRCAELANVINEAALLAARRGLKAITLAELEEARDKVRWGQANAVPWHSASRKRKIPLTMRRVTRCSTSRLPHTDPLHKVTIIPRGPSLGIDHVPAGAGQVQRTQDSRLLDRLDRHHGWSRGGGDQVFGDVTNGAYRRHQAWPPSLTRSMICHYGMSEKLGMVQLRRP